MQKLNIKLIGLIFIISFVILNIWGCCCCSKSSGNLSNNTPFPSPADISKENSIKETPKAEPTKKEVENIYKLNETFTCGDFSYKFTAVEKLEKIGDNQYNTELPAEGAVFVLVRYVEENLSKETKTVFTGRFKLIDNKEREFTESSKASTALSMVEKDQDWLLSQVQPGVPHKSGVIFEVPKDAKGFFIKISAGWSNPEIKINMGI